MTTVAGGRLHPRSPFRSTAPSASRGARDQRRHQHRAARVIAACCTAITRLRPVLMTTLVAGTDSCRWRCRPEWAPAPRQPLATSSSSEARAPASSSAPGAAVHVIAACWTASSSLRPRCRSCRTYETRIMPSRTATPERAMKPTAASSENSVSRSRKAKTPPAHARRNPRQHPQRVGRSFRFDEPEQRDDEQHREHPAD